MRKSWTLQWCSTMTTSLPPMLRWQAWRVPERSRQKRGHARQRSWPCAGCTTVTSARGVGRTGRWGVAMAVGAVTPAASGHGHHRRRGYAVCRADPCRVAQGRLGWLREVGGGGRVEGRLMMYAALSRRRCRRHLPRWTPRCSTCARQPSTRLWRLRRRRGA